MVGKMLAEVTEQNFDEEVLNSYLPVFACFTISGCSGCFLSCFIADELANRYEGRIKFVRIDKEKNPEISAKYHITVIPSIILFQDSQPIKKLLGYQEQRSLRTMLDIMTNRVVTTIGRFELNREV